MADKRPDQLPDATAGVKYVHAVNKDDLTDGPNGTSQRVVVNPDNVTVGNIPLKQSSGFEDSAMSEDASDITSTKPITAPEITTGVASLNLGNAISMKVGGENVYYRDGADGSIHGSVFHDVGDILPKARVRGAFHDQEVQQADKTDSLVNPTFTITPTTNDQILDFTLEAAVTQTNVTITVIKAGVTFYKNNIGTLDADIETQVSLIAAGVPVDVFAGQAYEITFDSPDGDVTLKGTLTGTVPFYALSWYEFEFQDLITADLPINEETLISGFSTAASQEPTATDTPIRIEFGVAQGTGSDPLEIDATGLIKCNQSGTYFIQVYVQYGRTTSAGACDLFFAAFVNGVQTGNSSHARLDDGDTLIPSRARSNITLTAGDELEFLLTRDSAGINNGGLFDGSPNAIGWQDSVCASIVMSRLVGNAATLQSDGDVVGPGSSIVNEIATYANSTGKEIRSNSEITAITGAIRRAIANQDLFLIENGTGAIRIGSTVDNEGIKVNDNVVTVDLYEFSNGEIGKTTGDFRFTLTTSGAEFEFVSPTEANVDIDCEDATYAGMSFSEQGVHKGGVGFRLNQITLQPNNWYEDNGNDRGIQIDLATNQTHVEGIKHWIDGIARVIQPQNGEDLMLRQASGNKIFLGQSHYIDSDEQVNLFPLASATDAALIVAGPTTIQVAPMNDTQLNDQLAGTGADYGKIAFRVSDKKLVYADDSGWHDVGGSSKKRSLDWVIGGDTIGISLVPGDNDTPKTAITNMPMIHYSVDGAARTPSPDYNQSTSTYTLPADAPAGMYSLGFHSRAVLQGNYTGSIDLISEILIWMSINGSDWGNTVSGITPTPNPLNPFAAANLFGDSFSSTSNAYLEPGDTITFFHSSLFSNSFSHNPSHLWFTDESYFRLMFIGEGGHR